MLRRLINDEIYVLSTQDIIALRYYSESVLEDSMYFSENQYYICDVDGDEINEIGIQFEDSVYIYEYDEERDFLYDSEFHGVALEIFGDGKKLDTYDYRDRVCYSYTIENPFGEEFELVRFAHVHTVDLPDGTEVAEDHYFIDDVEVTEEQWQSLFVRPMERLRRKAPQPFSYEELMRD